MAPPTLAPYRHCRENPQICARRRSADRRKLRFGVAADDAYLGQTEVKAVDLTLNSPSGLLTIGPRKTKELIFNGGVFTGAEAAELEMIDQAEPGR